LTVSKNGAGNVAISIKKYTKMDKNGTSKKKGFCFLNAKYKLPIVIEIIK